MVFFSLCLFSIRVGACVVLIENVRMGALTCAVSWNASYGDDEIVFYDYICTRCWEKVNLCGE